MCIVACREMEMELLFYEYRQLGIGSAGIVGYCRVLVFIK